MKTRKITRFTLIASSASLALVALICTKLPENPDSSVAEAKPAPKSPERPPASPPPPKQDSKPEQAAPEIVGSTDAIVPQWISHYKVPVSNLDEDPNGDGITNRRHMIAGTDPFNGAGNPYIIDPPDTSHLSEPIDAPDLHERREILRKLLARAEKSDREHLENTRSEATRRGIPMRQGEAVLDGFAEDGSPLYLSPSNIALADTSGIDELWPSGSVTAVGGWTTGSSGLDLDGDGQTLAMWEATGGVLETHSQFGGRVSQLDLATPSNAHATSVAGAMASAGISYSPGSFDIGNHSRGAAYEANVHAHDTDFFNSEFLAEGLDSRSLGNLSVELEAGWVEDAGDWRWFGNPSHQESHLLGNYVGGTSGLAPQNVDNLVHNVFHFLPVFAASNNRGPDGLGEGPGDPGGSPLTYFLDYSTTTSTAPRVWNDGDEGGYDTLSPTAVAKNILTVGACYDIPGGYTAPGDVAIAPFSAFGPTDDGRIKPEIVAAGIRDPEGIHNPLEIEGSIQAGYNSSDPTNGDLYYLQTGTSMAAPIVTGGLALALQRRHQIRPAWETNDWPIQASTLRALAVHTADEAGPHPGPDFRFGYGLFNALKATQLVGADAPAGNKPHVKEMFLTNFVNGNFKIRAASSGEPLKVTIAWTDSSGAASAAGVVDPTAKRLVNDLNLSITGPSGTHLPWVLNPDLTGKSASNRSQAATTGVDSTNNLEQVSIPSPATGVDYTVNITRTGTIASPGQWVSVILSNNTVPTEDFRITGLTMVAPGHWIISWNSVSGAIYRLQASPNPATWTDVTGDISGTADSLTQLVSAPGMPPSYFWRVIRLY